MLSNPQGYWDWWGYDDPNYALKSGRQIKAVYSMVQRIVSAHISPACECSAGHAYGVSRRAQKNSPIRLLLRCSERQTHCSDIKASS
jgi:hypothetical protein